ncbi:hypothetical protein E4U43_005810, partial [Claviceps pusilla]
MEHLDGREWDLGGHVRGCIVGLIQCWLEVGQADAGGRRQTATANGNGKRQTAAAHDNGEQTADMDMDMDMGQTVD